MQKTTANQRARRRLRADLKSNLHLGAKLPPNSHDTPYLQSLSKKPATDVFRALTQVGGWLFETLNDSPAPHWQLVSVARVQTHDPPRRLKQSLTSPGEDMTRIATSDAPTLKLTRDINGPAGCLCFNLCSFFILIILLAYLLHVSHFNSCKDSQEPPRRVSYHGLGLHASREG